MNTLQQYRTELERNRGKREQIENSINTQKSKLRLLTRELTHIEQAQTILQTVARMTQEELEYHISDVVSLALSVVFDEPYELKLDFEIRRGKTEADIWFVRNGEKIHPLSASGGGAVDVASFALRVALWSLSAKQHRNVLILDEPFKFLSSNLQARAGEMLKQISKKLGLQIIMVSHIPDLIESADRTFDVMIKNGISEVKTR